MDAQDKTMISSDRTMVAPAMGADATVMGASVTCPVCKTVNAPTEKYCGDCGFLLSSTPVEEAALPDTGSIPRLTDGSGREYLLKDGENTVGREATDVLLNDPTVSRRHAKVVLEVGKAWLEDMGSSNGTSASGVRAQPGDRIEISDGAELKFGSAILTLLLPTPVEAAGPVEVAELADEEAVSEESAPEGVEEAIAPEAEPEEVMVEEPAGPAPVAKLISTTDPSKEFALIFGSNTIGRRSGNDVVLDGDPYVSGAHADITVDERGFWLTDIGSTNGTVLNGARINPNVHMALKSGDDIVFGQSATKFEIPEDETVEEQGA